MLGVDMLDYKFSQEWIRFKYPLTSVLHLPLNYVKYSFKMSNTCLTPLLALMLIRTNVRVLDIFSFVTFRCLTPLTAMSNTFSLRSVRSWISLCLTCLTPVDNTPLVFGKAVKLKCQNSPNVLISAIVLNTRSKKGALAAGWH